MSANPRTRHDLTYSMHKLIIRLSVSLLLVGVTIANPAAVQERTAAGVTPQNVHTSTTVELGLWYRIGPFRDQGPLLNWMDNVEAGFHHEFTVEKDAMSPSGAAFLSKRYPAPNFPATPGAVRIWTKHPEWIDGYYQELPRGPAPSAGESQYLYRTLLASENSSKFGNASFAAAFGSTTFRSGTTSAVNAGVESNIPSAGL